jgi:hypothetical protein
VCAIFQRLHHVPEILDPPLQVCQSSACATRSRVRTFRMGPSRKKDGVCRFVYSSCQHKTTLKIYMKPILPLTIYFRESATLSSCENMNYICLECIVLWKKIHFMFHKVSLIPRERRAATYPVLCAHPPSSPTKVCWPSPTVRIIEFVHRDTC